MTGIHWPTIGRETFEDIADILLGREFGLRGHSVNGRGGDAGIDYDVDDADIIFQYKFFWDGIPTSGSRRQQITRSFKQAMKHNPSEWILVVPAKFTPAERLFVTGLGKGKSVKIGIRDLDWLTSQLIQHTDIRDHFLHGSDIEYLHELGEKFKYNPVVRNAGDVTESIRALQQSMAIVDPNWTLDVSTTDQEIVHTIRPKDPLAPERSPIKISFSVEAPAGSSESRDLDRANAFGHTQPIILGGEVIKDFKVTGSPLVNYEGAVGRIELHPAQQPTDWQPTELILRDTDARQVGIYLAESRIVSEGAKGFTLEATINNLVKLLFRWSKIDQTGEFDLSTTPFENSSITAAFDAADYIVQAANATTLEVRVKGQQIGLLGIGDGQITGPADDMVTTFEDIRLLADDLRVIEREAAVRFRVPGIVETEERINIRNLRLLLEGHCVAHPTNTSLTAKLSGDRDDSFDQMLTTDLHWMVGTIEPAGVTVLGQTIMIEKLSHAAAVSLTQDEIAAVNSVFAEGRAAGHPIKWRTKPGDRIRMFIPTRMAPDARLIITPWNIRGVTQQGLGENGERLSQTSSPIRPPTNLGQDVDDQRE